MPKSHHAVPQPKWREICERKREDQRDSIPNDWRIQRLPIRERPNVIDLPTSFGLLTGREVDITETVDVDYILRKLRSGEWSSVEVTTAFYKRAIIAHQVVRRCITI